MITRRDLLRGVAGAVGLIGLPPEHVSGEPPPETTTLRIADARGGICIAPQWVAADLFAGEGFTSVQYLLKDTFADRLQALATGEAHMAVTFVSSLISRIDAGDPIVLLAGSHVGCFELFGTERVRAIRDLKGKTVAISAVGAPDHLFLSVILLQVGLDPRRDVNWVESPPVEAVRLLAESKIDAVLYFPPVPQELRSRRIGRVILNSTTDRPWSQYFCCVLAAHREFVRKHPVAAKRVVRAITKAADVCALEPERAARFLVDKGYTERYDYTIQALREVPYAKWREYDPEDTVRFYSLRLHEAGFIKSSPQKILAQGTNWRFLKELKKELKS